MVDPCLSLVYPYVEATDEPFEQRYGTCGALLGPCLKFEAEHDDLNDLDNLDVALADTEGILNAVGRVAQGTADGASLDDVDEEGVRDHEVFPMAQAEGATALSGPEQIAWRLGCGRQIGSVVVHCSP